MVFRAMVVIVLGLVARNGAAAVVAYTSETDFLNATSPTVVDSFETDATGWSTSLDTSYFNVTTTPLNGGTSRVGVQLDDDSTDGLQQLHAGSVTNDGWRLDFTLDQEIYAIAFDITDASERQIDGGGQSFFTMSLPTSDTFIISSCPPCLPNLSVQFFGVVSDTPFSSFSMTNTAWSDGIFFDRAQITFAAATSLPEAPIPLWLFGAVLGFATWLGHRKSAQAGRKRLGFGVSGRPLTPTSER